MCFYMYNVCIMMYPYYPCSRCCDLIVFQMCLTLSLVLTSQYIEHVLKSFSD